MQVKHSRTTKRILLKTVVLGFDPALQAGYLNMAAGSNLSHQLFNAVGVCIGVVNVQQEHERVAIQMWSLPLEERLQGLTQSFMRGRHVVIIVLRPEEVKEVQRILNASGITDHERIMYVIIGDEPEASEAITRLQSTLDRSVNIGVNNSVIDTVLNMIKHFSFFSEKPDSPLIVKLSPEICRPFVATMGTEKFPANTPEEVEAIIHLARGYKLEISDDETEVIFALPLGKVKLNIVTGSVIFYPTACELCKNTCKRKIRLCIVTADSGWTNTPFSPGALFTIAKLYAFATQDLPQDVESQMLRAVQCSKFNPIDSFDNEMKRAIMPPQGHPHLQESLMQIALRRLRSGKLNRETFEMLKKRLKSARQG
ncbi:MAG: hypothetical protein K9W43_10565 [Candidatus Thorarchaeota archaeon]|nr:hypothetical protein [Candidatus Thorarchaeota archaeon]